MQHIPSPLNASTHSTASPVNKSSVGDTALLNRAAILKYLRTHGGKELGIGSGAAMVLHGLRSTTHDIDAESSPLEFNSRLERYGNPPVRISTLGSRVFTVPGTPIDLHEGAPKGAYFPEYNARVESLTQLLRFYSLLNRPKDQRWIKKLQRIKSED